MQIDALFRQKAPFDVVNDNYHTEVEHTYSPLRGGQDHSLAPLLALIKWIHYNTLLAKFYPLHIFYTHIGTPEYPPWVDDLYHVARAFLGNAAKLQPL